MEAKKLHFIGIGGIGMSGIAKIMLDMGYDISGSDLNTSPLTAYLQTKGATVYQGHRAENLAPDRQAVVYSSAVKADNPELAAAKERGLPVYQRAEMLAFLMSLKQSIGVAGAHGKTTTSGMISLMLENAAWTPPSSSAALCPSSTATPKAAKGIIWWRRPTKATVLFCCFIPALRW